MNYGKSVQHAKNMRDLRAEQILKPMPKIRELNYLRPDVIMHSKEDNHCPACGDQGIIWFEEKPDNGFCMMCRQSVIFTEYKAPEIKPEIERKKYLRNGRFVYAD